jgi:hypothetical protein
MLRTFDVVGAINQPYLFIFVWDSAQFRTVPHSWGISAHFHRLGWLQVGATEQYEEFLLLLSDTVGLQHIQHLVSNSAKHEKRREGLAPSLVQTIEQVTSDADGPLYQAVAEMQRRQVRHANFVTHLLHTCHNRYTFGTHCGAHLSPPHVP